MNVTNRRLTSIVSAGLLLSVALSASALSGCVKKKSPGEKLGDEIEDVGDEVEEEVDG